MEKNVKVSLTILVVVIISAVALNVIGSKITGLATSEKVISCSETDNVQDICSKGLVVTENEKGGAIRTLTSEDRCINVNTLQEFYCDKLSVIEIRATCKEGCMDGACLPLKENPEDFLTPVGCEETDNGKDYNKKGQTVYRYNTRLGEDSIFTDTLIDKCETSYILKEYSCNGLSTLITYFKCSRRCLSGACV